MCRRHLGWNQIIIGDGEMLNNDQLLLCHLAEKYGIWNNLRYIEFTGEYLELPLRHRVEAVFGCRTANQYGTKEVNSIAYKCPEGNLHVMSDNVLNEYVNNE